MSNRQHAPSAPAPHRSLLPCARSQSPALASIRPSPAARHPASLQQVSSHALQRCSLLRACCIPANTLRSTFIRSSAIAATSRSSRRCRYSVAQLHRHCIAPHSSSGHSAPQRAAVRLADIPPPQRAAALPALTAAAASAFADHPLTARGIVVSSLHITASVCRICGHRCSQSSTTSAMGWTIWPTKIAFCRLLPQSLLIASTCARTRARLYMPHA